MKILLSLLLLPVTGIIQTKTAIKPDQLFAKNVNAGEPRKHIASSPDVYALTNQKITINGTSNLHDWHQKVEKASGKGLVNQAPDKSLSLQNLGINIEVRSIKGDGSTMDSKTYKAMKADKFPNISFIITDPIANIPFGIKAFSTTAKGQLTIAGKTKVITMPVKINTSEDRKISVSGSHQVKMTDYGVDPPTAMLGMLKTGDAVNINFETTFSITTSVNHL